MFVYSYWDEICKNISNDFNIIKAEDILNNLKQENWLVVKHDVETDVEKALQIAKIEKKHDICATYYVQGYLIEINKATLQEIASMGHEIAYHYDVLDEMDGDYDKALIEFKKYLKEFANIGIDIKTVCPHGNPVKVRNGWSSNKDFFRNKKIRDTFPNILDIVIDLPKILDNKYIYISDAGYSFKLISNVSDNDKKNGNDIDISDKLFDTLKKNSYAVISTHPHRWENSKIKFIFKLLFFRTIRFVAKKMSSVGFLKKIMSRYYYLAKKV